MSRRAILAGGVAGATAVVSASRLGSGNAVAETAEDESLVDFRSWVSAEDWESGQADGVEVAAGDRPGIVVGEAHDVVEYTDPHTGTTSSWEMAMWTSPTHDLDIEANELISSWNVDTPSGTWIAVEMRGEYDDGEQTPWYVMGRWAEGEDDITRTSVNDQSDSRSAIWTDAFIISDPDAHRLTSYQLRVSLYREPDSDLTPTVWRVGAMSSYVPDRFEVPASSPGVAAGVELDVPPYSQSIHAGRYPEYGGGGQAWCSPTSSQMILESFGREPSEEDLEWVDPDFDDPQVCHAARQTYDAEYDGCGNWSFNVAYASTYEDMDAIVTRIRTMDDAEELIAAGFPLITSKSFLEEELDGSGYGTAGHLMTLIGFTSDGDVIANDPASPDNDAVRRVYNRRQFENIWLRTKRYDADGNVAGGSGGVCYLFKPTDQEWPELPGVES